MNNIVRLAIRLRGQYRDGLITRKSFDAAGKQLLAAASDKPDVLRRVKAQLERVEKERVDYATR